MKTRNIILLFTIILYIVSCEDPIEPGPNKPVIIPDSTRNHDTLLFPLNEKERTVLFYFVADGDNSLSNRLNNNIYDIFKSCSADFDGNIVIYADLSGNLPYLLYLYVDEEGETQYEFIKIYEEQNSANPAVLKQVIEDIFHLTPARSYGLVCGSHGDGWIPPKTLDLEEPDKTEVAESVSTEHLSRAFAWDNEEVMDIVDMAQVLPNSFEYILFDMCFMSSIEVLYQIKDKANYIIASATEVPQAGFPYIDILPLLWGDEYLEEDLALVCDIFVNYYEKTGSGRFATISLIDTKELQKLQDLTKEILSERLEEIESIDIHEDPTPVFRYPLVNKVQKKNIYFDFGAFINYMNNDEDYEEIYESICEQLEKVVIHKNKTSTFYYRDIPDESYSGLSTFIPLSIWSNQLDYDYYFSLDWNSAIY